MMICQMIVFGWLGFIVWTDGWEAWPGRYTLLLAMHTLCKIVRFLGLRLFNVCCDFNFNSGCVGGLPGAFFVALHNAPSRCDPWIFQDYYRHALSVRDNNNLEKCRGHEWLSFLCRAGGMAPQRRLFLLNLIFFIFPGPSPRLEDYF